MSTVITARDIHKSYPRMGEVLKGVDLTVEAGEFVAIMGPSGCGKSTLLHLLGLLHRPDSGELDILGTNVLGLSETEGTLFRRDHMGFILQSNNMFAHTNVYENVEFPLIYKKVPRPQRPGLIEGMLRKLNLGHRIRAWSNNLSGGEQQRVAISRSLVNHPQILYADEPTGALDTANSHSLMKIFRDISRKENVSIIMVTHDATMATYCDTLYTLEEGRICSTARQKPSEKPVSAPDGSLPEI